MPPAPEVSRSRARPVALISAVAIGCVLAAFVALLATRSSAVDKQARSPLLGKPAPPISGQDLLTGSTVSLAGLHGRYVLINFFASWCIPCQQETPQLARWTARHGTDGSVLAVTFEDSAANARSFLQRSNAHWPVVFDDGPVALDYGIRGPPESYLVNPDGIVLAKFIGGVTADGLDRVLGGAA
jgi:cytochrome c biogenesis protein CcmG, thiol:disulfide interchange protein DsbE